MTRTLIYECPVCDDRKLVDDVPRHATIKPTVWCSHLGHENGEPFTQMTVDYDSEQDDVGSSQ